MRKKMKNAARTSVLFLSMLPGLCIAGQIQHQPVAFDGRWWLSVSYNERRGFVEGYWGCYNREYQGGDTYSKGFDNYVALITKRYQKGPPVVLEQSVVSELHALRDRPGEEFADPNDEPMPVPSGLDWAQMDATAGPDMEQLGFIEGYLTYHDALNHGEGKVFSKSAETYVSDVNAWFGYVESTAALNPDREDTPIADVLFMFADKPASSKPSGD